MVKYYTQCFSSLAVSAGVLCSATYLSWSATHIFMTEESPIGKPLSLLEIKWIHAIYFLGGVVASPMVPSLLEKLGRKKSMLIAAIILAVSWFPIMFGSYIQLIFAGRALGGAGAILASTAAQVYIGETSEDAYRGIFASSYFLLLSIGMLLAVLFRLYASYTAVAIIGVAVGVLYFLGVTLITESPYFYMKSGLREEAKRVLIGLEPPGFDEIKIERKLVHIQESLREDARHANESIFGTSIYRKHMLVLVGLKILQQVCGQAVLSNFIEVYGLFAAITPMTSLPIYYSFHVLVAFVSMCLVDKLGRKLLLILSSMGCALSLLALRIFYYVNDYGNPAEIMMVPYFLSIVFASTASLGIYSVPYVIMSEIFPANIKSSAVAFSMFLEFGFSFIFMYWINPLMIVAGPHVELSVYFVCCVTGASFVHSCVPETKKMSFEDIQKRLSKHPIE